jgi:PilZ domain
MERRLPIIVVVRLARTGSASHDTEERTFTDNISPHGARIFSSRPWQPGEAIRVTPLHQAAASGRVIYCQKLPDDRYSIGLQFQDRPVTWSTLQKYNGLLS